MIDLILKFFDLKTAAIDAIVITHKPLYSDVALALMHQVEKTLDKASGEWKAHNVYANLIKRYPEVNKADLRFEIECLHQRHFRHD